MWLLDTDLFIYFLNGRGTPQFRNRVGDRLITRSLALSAIAAGELFFGVERSNRPHENRKQLEEMLPLFDIVPFDQDCAAVYGAIRHSLATRGQLIGPMDLLIAATSIATSRTLVSNNAREFGRVPGLRLENWLD